MFKLETTTFGLKLTIRGKVDPSETANLKAELEGLLSRHDGPFSVLVDATELIPPDPESSTLLQECQEAALSNGMQRMAILLKSPVVKARSRQIAHLSGAADITKHINAATIGNAEQIALAWAVDGIEPEALINPVDQQSNFIPLQQ